MTLAVAINVTDPLGLSHPWLAVGFTLDLCIVQLQNTRSDLIEHSDQGTALLIWVAYSTALAIVSVMMTHYISPHAIGSGIPEMKVILKGINLSKYLTFPTLVAKVFGLIFALGSGTYISPPSTVCTCMFLWS